VTLDPGFGIRDGKVPIRDPDLQNWFYDLLILWHSMYTVNLVRNKSGKLFSDDPVVEAVPLAQGLPGVLHYGGEDDRFPAQHGARINVDKNQGRFPSLLSSKF
jgi:hypothetical protein